MANYSVSDYKLFDDLVNNNTELYRELEDVNKTIDGQINVLKSDYFIGTMFDNSIDFFNKYKNSFNSLISDLKSMNIELKNVCADYKKRDKQASSAVSSNKNSNTNSSSYDGGSYDVANTIPNVTPSGKYSAYKNPANVSDYRLTFINAISDKANDMYNKYGTLPSLTMAQAILESGWGRGTKGNNMYNIRTYPGDGRMYVDDGLTGTYRAYKTIYDAMEDYGKFMNGSRYAPVLAANDYKEAAYQVKQCGYATDGRYVEKLISVIETYGLNQWDPK